ncbi:MAG: helix-turn-helix domain-containing protein [Pseudolabrys sp.]|nr:helix-turn-helix domain-containing protein [Pseudolabrys sp.]
MDPLITSAARALSTGKPLDALNCIALRDDPAALALRGIAMAQLGDLARAKTLLRRAARAFGPREVTARARCAVAAAEIALVSRDLTWPAKALAAAGSALERHGDRANAAHARYLRARCLLLLGRIDAAERLLARFDPRPLPPASRAAHALLVAGIAMRRLRIEKARAALREAERAGRQAGIVPLLTEIENAALMLDKPAARLIAAGAERPVKPDEIETLLASRALVVDACRRVVCHAGKAISLKRRPVLFALARVLAEAWPGDVARAALLARAFRAKHADDSHRARLRVEIGRLRKALGALAGIEATAAGFVLVPRRAFEIAVLAPATEESHATVLALLADGETWSTSALALALGASQRTVQRALEELAADGRAQAVGRGRARRWMAPPVPGFPTSLLLPTALPAG